MEAGALAVYIPERLVVEARRRGFDVESLVVELLTRALNLDPQATCEVHLELSHRYLGEGRALVYKDPVQASEKLYKAAEEAVKALAIFYNLQDVLSGVEGKGRWTVSYLEKAVEAISEKLGGWFLQSWDNAWALHVWGFHEAKLDSKAVEIRLPYVERMVLEAEKIVRGRIGQS
ncbi:MAG: PaREP1 family protein [Thaumarchaeota archaeon]|nr:PaREP1 family protein [Nitrososphaerota archaeon]